MTRFIFFCMAIIALSFLVVPLFSGISKEHDVILDQAAKTTQTAESDSLSFDEIYDIADTNEGFNPEQLNNIAPAAGANSQDNFSSGFGGQIDSALEDIAPQPIADEIDENASN